ncbi:MAG: 3-isopropylmalate dehydratase large subunit [SAR324 cluster bacterium]|nr:3-isopropylmalate dehydratase large subunit [SAR324 cluster bacterium]
MSEKDRILKKGATLLDKIWDQHVVRQLGSGLELMHIDRTFIHDLSGGQALVELGKKDLKVRNPELCFATTDHCVSSAPGRNENSSASGARLIPLLRKHCMDQGITLFDIYDEKQGIVHVIGPELGLTLPGLTLVCGDSHTCTHGALGALAWGIGRSELEHVLATQTVIGKKPRKMRIKFQGSLNTNVYPKDIMLYLISKFGADFGSGHAVEYAGSTIRNLSMEERMTICNLSIELGARIGLIAPDEVTFQYLANRPYSPTKSSWKKALQHWQSLHTDKDARFEQEIEVQVSKIAPQISWGISPAHTISISEHIPNPDAAPDENTRLGWENALQYMDLKPGQAIEGLPIQRVFIGSCANSRLSDLQSAADLVKGKKVSNQVEAWVVPGSQQVKREAEISGLDQIFIKAGFKWREPGCSQCVATNEEYVESGKHCVSTSNRNFIGRQGPQSRTHLASPAMAACAAITGKITDIRKFKELS